MSYRVVLKRKMVKKIQKLPLYEKKVLKLLLNNLADNGPLQKDWKNFSSLGENRYHCHLPYKWVACWYHENKQLTIEVFYVGSREKAPY